MHELEIRDRSVSTNGGHTPFVKIPKTLRLFAVDHQQNISRRVAPLLHRNRRDSWQRSASLVREIREIADDLHLRMIWNREIVVYDDATDAVDWCAEGMADG